MFNYVRRNSDTDIKITPSKLFADFKKLSYPKECKIYGIQRPDGYGHEVSLYSTYEEFAEAFEDSYMDIHENWDMMDLEELEEWYSRIDGTTNFEGIYCFDFGKYDDDE